MLVPYLIPSIVYYSLHAPYNSQKQQLCASINTPDPPFIHLTAGRLCLPSQFPVDALYKRTAHTQLCNGLYGYSPC